MPIAILSLSQAFAQHPGQAELRYIQISKPRASTYRYWNRSVPFFPKGKSKEYLSSVKLPCQIIDNEQVEFKSETQKSWSRLLRIKALSTRGAMGPIC